MTEIRTHPDGSTTIGPRDPHRDLVETLAEYANIIDDKAEARKLAWFLGDRGETEAAKAIMKYAAVQEPWWSSAIGVPMWGYLPTGRAP